MVNNNTPEREGEGGGVLVLDPPISLSSTDSRMLVSVRLMWAAYRSNL